MIRELGSGDGTTTVALVSTGESGWPILFVSEGFAEATGDSPVPSVPVVFSKRPAAARRHQL